MLGRVDGGHDIARMLQEAGTSAVSDTPVGWRRNSATPTSSSSWRIAAVTADCETLSAMAAWLTCPASAVAMK